MASTNQDRMLGRKHRQYCDCNIEQFISGADEKCNHRYGVKRARAQEKRRWRRTINSR